MNCYETPTFPLEAFQGSTASIRGILEIVPSQSPGFTVSQVHKSEVQLDYHAMAFCSLFLHVFHAMKNASAIIWRWCTWAWKWLHNSFWKGTSHSLKRHKNIQSCHTVGAHRIKPIQNTNTQTHTHTHCSSIHSRQRMFIWYTVCSRGVMSTSRQHHIWSCSPVSSQCLQWSGSRRGKIQWWYQPNLPCYVMWHMTLRFWYLKYLDVIEQLVLLWQW